MNSEQAYKILGLDVKSGSITVDEAYAILKRVVSKILERNQFTYITAESKWRNVMLSLFCPSLLLSAGELVQEMHELSLLLHSLDERLENRNEKEKPQN